MTEGRSNAAAWASAMHAGTQAMRRCGAVCLSVFMFDIPTRIGVFFLYVCVIVWISPKCGRLNKR